MSDPGSQGADCPDLETLAARIDDRLDARDRAAVEAHLAHCDACREVLVDTAAAMAHSPVPARQAHARWLTAAAAVFALAGASWAVLPTGTSAPGEPVADLAPAVKPDRGVEPRFVGDFRWGPVPSVSRWAVASRQPSPEVEIAAARLAQALRAKRAPPELAAIAARAMMLGRIDEATAALEEATGLDPGSADLWSDLSAAYFVRSVTFDRAVDLPRSLEAAEEALQRNALHLEARFNRALALDRLQRRPQALDAWQRYLEVDPSSDWAREARDHIARLNPQVQGARGGPAPDARPRGPSTRRPPRAPAA